MPVTETKSTDTNSMTKMQKVVLLLTFWFTHPTEEKYQLWMDFAGDAELDEDTILGVINDVTFDGGNEYDWSALDPFIEETNRNMN